MDEPRGGCKSRSGPCSVLDGTPKARCSLWEAPACCLGDAWGPRNQTLGQALSSTNKHRPWGLLSSGFLSMEVSMEGWGVLGYVWRKQPLRTLDEQAGPASRDWRGKVSVQEPGGGASTEDS